MKELLLIASILLLIHSSLQACQLQSDRGVPGYVCSSLQELEYQINPFAYNVVVNSSKIQTQQKPTAEIVLLQDIHNGASPALMQILRDFSKLFQSEIYVLPAGVLSGLPIEKLILERNGLLAIQPGALSNLTHLKALKIAHNQLSGIKGNIFNNLPIERLSLSHNLLTYFEKDAFKDMPELTHLYLDHNKLSSFDPDILMNYPETVEVLWLQSNEIADIARHTFRKMTNLRKLRLDGNEIVQIAPYAFEHLTLINTLILSFNKIKELNSDIFLNNNVGRLRTFYINDNRLAYLTTNLLNLMSGLRRVRIGGNPWQCPCLDAIQAWLHDYGVEQDCDRNYYSGTRPICVVYDGEPKTCVYGNSKDYFPQYDVIHSQSPQIRECGLEGAEL